MGELFQDIAVDPGQVAPGGELERCTQEQARALGQESSAALAWGGQRYTIAFPPAEPFLAALADGEGFALVCSLRDVWNLLRMVCAAAEAIQQRCPADMLNSRAALNAATRLCRQRLPGDHALVVALAEDYVAELLADLRFTPASPRFWRGGSFTGAPATDGRLFVAPGQSHENDALNVGMVRVFAACFAPGTPLVDATAPKRWAISGSLRRLTGLLRSRPALVVGPPWLFEMGRRWSLPDLVHIPVPVWGSVFRRYSLLERICEEIAAQTRPGGPAPAVLFRGGTLAGWFIHRLRPRFPQALLLDFGVALDAGYMDNPLCSGLPWMRIYGRAIIENNGLEPYYRNIVGELYDKWLAKFL